MRKRIFLFLILCLCVIGLTTGCGNSFNKKIAGTWKYEWESIYGDECTKVYTFNEDGTGSYSFRNWSNEKGFVDYNFKYEVEDDIITIIYTDPDKYTGSTKDKSYIQFKNESDGITLIDLCSDKSCNDVLEKSNS